MSEMASAGSSAGVSSASSAASGGTSSQSSTSTGFGTTSTSTSQGSESSSNRSVGHDGNSAGGDRSHQSSRNQNQTESEPAGGDEFDEIAVGSVKGKVPKALAKAIKDLERGTQKKFEEFARIRKSSQAREQLLGLLETDPDAFAQAYSQMTGKKFDIDSFAEERLARKYEQMNMSPEQRELLDAQKKLKGYEQADLQSKQGVISEIKKLLGNDVPQNLERYSKEQLHGFLDHKRGEYQQVEQSLHSEIREAWKEAGLPQHKYFGSLLAFQMMSHARQNKGQENFQPLQAKEAAAKVKSDFTSAVKEIVSLMDPKGIQELLGKDVVQKLREFDVERVTQNAASRIGQNQRPGNNQPASEQSEKKYLNQLEWRKAMGF